ncbi:MAG: serine/threonine-protein kinase [Phycisphaerae bacterium]
MAYTFKHGDRPLDGYTIQRGIGRGGFGEVYYAVSDGGREVALKYLRDNSEIELRGVAQCMNLKSPYLVSIFDVRKNDQGDYFIIMEHIAGPSLGELLIAEPNGLGVEKAAFFLREIGKGLADLHDRGIVHRDMKPANIFYEDGHVKIGDYGLSKFISVSRHSAQTTSIGTVHYMAPEVGSGNYHRGIDIYALGVMLYEMLLGRVPFEGSSMGEVLMKHLTEQPEVAGLPEPFGKVIRKALEKDPRDRYQNVNEMIDDMLEVGSVRDSLAGFNPNTITSVPRKQAPEAMHTPVPSPNPVPWRAAAGPVVPVGIGDLPASVAKRLGKVSEKVERKMDQLAGRPVGRGVRRRAAKAAYAAVQAHDLGWMKRALLSLLIVVGVGLGVGFLAYWLTGRDYMGVTAGFMVPAVVVGLGITYAVLRAIGAAARPDWIQRATFVVSAAGPMAAACGPLFGEYGEDGVALLIGMMVTVIFMDDRARVEAGARGELSFGRAFWLAVWGGICCAIAASVSDVGNEENYMQMGACAAAGISLAIEALGWVLPPGWLAITATEAENKTVAPKPAERSEKIEKAKRSPVREMRQASGGWSDVEDAPFAIPVAEGTPTSGYASTAPLTAARSGFARGFWSVVVFVLLFGMVVCILFAALVRHDRKDDLLGCIVGAVACGSLMLFAAQKLTRRKRRGFWKETLCPFLIAVVMTGFTACVCVLAVKGPRNEELALTISGLVFASLLFGVLMASRFGAFEWLANPYRGVTGGRGGFVVGLDPEDVDTSAANGGVLPPFNVAAADHIVELGSGDDRTTS